MASQSAFFTRLHGAGRTLQLTKWLSCPKKSQIFLCSPSAAHSGAQGTAKLTHIIILQLTTCQFSMCSHVNGIRSSLVSRQFPWVSSTHMQLQMQLKAFRKAVPSECPCCLDNSEPHNSSNARVPPSGQKYHN